MAVCNGGSEDKEMKRLLQSVLALLLFVPVTGCSSEPAKNHYGYKEQGKASYYADKFQSRKTANGERFDQDKSTAAHKKLPFGTRVRVTNVENGKSVVVRINDRGPFSKGRIIDLSRSAFSKIGDLRQGLMNVKIEVVK